MTEPKKEREKFSPPMVGGSSLLVVFAVLCLTVFALLSLSTVQADRRLADASVETVSAYYAADCQAQEILARLRSGEVPEGVTVVEDLGTATYAYYSCPMTETQSLEVEVRLDGTSYQILSWQTVATGEWELDESMNLWDGSFNFE